MRWVYMVTLSKVLFWKWYCNRFSFALSHTFSIVSLILSLKWTEISLNWLRLSVPYWRSWSNSEVKQIIPYYSIVSLSQFFFFFFFVHSLNQTSPLYKALMRQCFQHLYHSHCFNNFVFSSFSQKFFLSFLASAWIFSSQTIIQCTFPKTTNEMKTTE